MKIKSLRLTNFRNYSFQALHFTAGKNLFIGKNAQGKSNILEAIFCLSNLRSFRTSRIAEMIKWAEEGFFLKGDVVSKGMHNEITMFYSSKKKRITRNSQSVPRATDVLGLLYTVVFSPTDMMLIKGDPSVRRRFLDTLLSQISPSYLVSFQKYRKILKEKNVILKSERINDTLLNTYNHQLAESGSNIIYLRKRLIDKLNQYGNDIFYRFSVGKGKLQLHFSTIYDKLFPLTREKVFNVFLEFLNERKEAEKRRRISLIGPHRDDLVIEINGIDAKRYASEGQKRAITISLKMAEFGIAKEIFKEPPVVLIDDVFGELDAEKKAVLNEIVQATEQTFITCTEKENVAGLAHNARQYKVENGRIQTS